MSQGVEDLWILGMAAAGPSLGAVMNSHVGKGATVVLMGCLNGRSLSPSFLLCTPLNLTLLLEG